MIRRFVALGDSFTEGLEDPGPDGAYRGWADLVAEQLSRQVGGLLYANLAVRGRKIERIRTEQAPAALAMAPDLITVGAGGNDIMGFSCDVDALGRQFHELLAELTGSGARVVAFAGFDPRRRIPLAQIPGARAAKYNEHIRRSCEVLGATLIDLWKLQELYAPGMWAPDRLHLSSAGHALVAKEVLQSLGVPAYYRHSSETATQVSGPAWAVRYLAPWLIRGIQGRSSGDGLEAKRPELLPVQVPN